MSSFSTSASETSTPGDSVSTVVDPGTCGHCGRRNESEAKFCGGCGEALWEECQQCKASSPIGRRFCGKCGESLETQLRSRLQRGEEQIRRAVQLANEHQYEDAVYLLKQQQTPTDYRFEDVAQRAKRALGKVEATRDRWFAKRDAALEAANAAWEQQDHRQVVQLLGQIPAPLLDAAARERLASSQTAHERSRHWRRELKDALAERDFMNAGMVLGQLLTSEPENAEYQGLARKVTRSLVDSAERQMLKGRYKAAMERLQSIPSSARDENICQLIGRLDDVLWMTRQIAREPFAFPRLGRLAQRLANLVPEDPRPKQLVQDLVQAVKQTPPDPRQHVASWRGSDVSWLEAPVRILAVPQRIKCKHPDALRKQPGVYSVAIGLALQGLGLGRAIPPLHAPKQKGLKKLLKRSAPRDCIGIDLGATAVRAVHLQRSDSGDAVMVKGWQEVFEAPLCRAGLDVRLSEIRRRGMERIAEQIAGVDAPIWVNLPGRDVLGRFVLLPPIKDKEITPLLDREVDQQFPVGREQLMIARWLQSETEAKGGARRGALIACRDGVALERLALFNDVGIRPAALQCDPLALVTFASYEFQKHLSGGDGGVDADEPALALVDAAASSLTFLAITSSAFWFRSLDGGGEQFTAQLIKDAALTAEQAEQAKRDPALLDAPAAHFGAIEERCAATRQRLRQMADDASGFLASFHPETVWTIGGASCMHGWIPRVLGRETC